MSRGPWPTADEQRQPSSGQAHITPQHMYSSSAGCPMESPARAVMGLNVEPGAYAPPDARFKKRFAGLCISRVELVA